MVAPTTNTYQSPHDEAPSFTTYSHPIDRDAARYNPDCHELHPYTFHSVFQPKLRLTQVEQRELAIKQAALRVAAGLEFRSLRTLAKHIGCTHTAIDNAVKRVCDRTGMRKYHVSDTTRHKQSEARRKHLSEG